MEPDHPKSTLSTLLGGLLPLFVLAHCSHHLLTALTIPLSPMIRSDFSLDYTYSGLVISAFNLSYGIGQLPGGWLADRIGPRIMITLGICGVAVAGFFVGLSHSFWMMIVFLALMGVLGGGYHPAAPPMISSFVEPRHRGRALGLHMIGGGASFFLSPLVATAIAAYWGWRGSFIGLAVPTLAFGIFFHLLLKKHGAGGPVERTQAHRASETIPTQRLLRPLIVFIFLSTFSAAVLFSVMSFIPLFLVDKIGFSKETAGAFYAIIYSAGLWVSPIGGYLSDRFGSIPVILIVLLLPGHLFAQLRILLAGNRNPAPGSGGHHLRAHAGVRSLYSFPHSGGKTFRGPGNLLLQQHGGGRDSHSGHGLSHRPSGFFRELHPGRIDHYYDHLDLRVPPTA
jgi:MFS family permease